MRFIVVFLSLPSDSTLKLGHDRFLRKPFQFIIHLSPYYWTLYSRRGQLGHLREPHFRRQQSARAMSYSSSQVMKSFFLCLLTATMLSKKRKYDDENREFEAERED
jgi:hypothetical protein